MTDVAIRSLIDSVPHWYHRIELAPGVVTPGVNDSEACLKLLGLPDSLAGQRVLDIGARDGFYSFECERRGAEVVAVDYARPEDTGFLVAKRIFGSKVNLIQENLYSLTPEKYGTFDLILFLGVLYHLRDPMIAIDTLRKLCREQLYVETHVVDQGLLLPDGQTVKLSGLNPKLLEIPMMQFYPRGLLNNDETNYWGPNMRCVEAMLEEGNFKVVSSVLNGQRAIFRCVVNSDERLQYLAGIGRGVI